MTNEWKRKRLLHVDECFLIYLITRRLCFRRSSKGIVPFLNHSSGTMHSILFLCVSCNISEVKIGKIKIGRHWHIILLIVCVVFFSRSQFEIFIFRPWRNDRESASTKNKRSIEHGYWIFDDKASESKTIHWITISSNIWKKGCSNYGNAQCATTR